MSGNVLEWCWDYCGSYTSDAKMDPTGAVSSGDGRVVRGRGWLYDASSARSACRSEYGPSSRGVIIGFRLVQSGLSSRRFIDKLHHKHLPRDYTLKITNCNLQFRPVFTIIQRNTKGSFNVFQNNKKTAWLGERAPCQIL